MHLVISMINVRPHSGPFTIFRECCEAAARLSDVHTTVLCSSLNDINEINALGIHYIAFPASRKCWFFRIFYEYIFFYFFAKKLKPDFWLSLHDMTPNIGKICKQAVYCHNPTPFYKASWRDLYYSPGVFLFSLFYKYLYRINIHSNQTVIVQQEWIRREFKTMFHLNDVLVAFPTPTLSRKQQREQFSHRKKYRFIYASRPRPFKNFELIGAAATVLYAKGIRDIEFILTIDGNENRYAKNVFQRNKDCPLIKFVGCLNQEELQNYYASSDAMIFPSKLETWGLGISEFKETGRPIFIADLPYAHETIGNYPFVITFNPLNEIDLADKIEGFCNGKIVPQKHIGATSKPPFVCTFPDMLKYLLYGRA